MSETDLPAWLIQSCSSLPCGRKPSFFIRLWSEKRLRFNGSGKKEADAIDELTARLACAALSKREQLLLVLPDKEPRRPALLFVTSLIYACLERMPSFQTGGNVLYFGSSTGIRAHVGQTSVNNLSLDSVFPQVRTIARDTGQTASRRPEVVGPEEISKLRLPQVLCVYSPADPISIIQRQPADWIAVDCGDGAAPQWLTPLLNHARARHLPVVAWCQNLLSESVIEFARAGGCVFRWPEASQVETKIVPVLLDGLPAENFAGDLESAQRSLMRATGLEAGKLGHDAIRFGWSILRSLEGLSVPLEIYEAEARSFWGLRSIARSQEGFARFVQAVSTAYPTLAAILEAALTHLKIAAERVRTTQPPLWTALTELCVADVPDGRARVIVFPGVSRKQLFAFALLSHLNITEEDLRSLRVWIWSLKDLHQALATHGRETGAGDKNDGLPRNLDVVPLLVGVPSLSLSARLTSIFRHGEAEVLLYPYQGPVLARRLALWKEALEISLAEEVKILPYLGGCLVSVPGMISPPQRLSLQAASYYKTGRSKKPVSQAGVASSLWQPIDPVEEVKWLLHIDSEADEERVAISGETKDIDAPSSQADGDKPWVEEAIAVRFVGGWHALFSSDDTIQVIVSGSEGDVIQERYTRSLRVGDRILFIHGQQRQTLYDLIISRTHRDPAFELHLAFIQRWRHDFREAYRQYWHWRGRRMEELLKALQGRGSKLTSVQTLRFWLRGQTLCPDDPEDLRRLAEELNLAFVGQYYRRIHNAAQRLAGLHRGLALRLNHWLRHGAVAGSEGADDIVDQELGLTFRDFRDSLLVLRVETIERRPGPFFRGSLGQLERSNNNERS